MSKQFFATTYSSSNTVITNGSFGWSGGFAVEAGPDVLLLQTLMVMGNQISLREILHQEQYQLSGT